MSDSRLFIGQLPGDVTEQEISEVFSQHGEVTDIFIPHSTKPRKIAFVTYASAKSLYAALAEASVSVRGEEVALTKALPKGSAPPPFGGPVEIHRHNPTKSTRLFINNLASSTTSDEIRGYFEEFGEVTDVFFKPPNAFGFVTFENERDMHKALARNPCILKGVELKIEVAKPKPSARGGGGHGGGGGYLLDSQPSYAPQYQQPQYAYAPPAAAPVSRGPNSRLFIGALSSAVSTDSLTSYFEQFGTIKDLFRPNKESGTFAFVTYEQPNSMFAVLAAEQHVLNGVEMRITEADPRPPKGGDRAPYQAPAFHQAPPSRQHHESSSKKEWRIYIGKIDASVSDDDLRGHFGQFGDVFDVYRPGVRRGGATDFGFIIFEAQQGMAKSLAQSSHVVQGTELQVTRARERPGQGFASQQAMAPPPQPVAVAYDAYSPYGYVQAPVGQQAYNPYMGVPGYAPMAYGAAEQGYSVGGSSRGGKSSRYSPY